MKNKGKSVKSEQNNPNFFSDCNYFASSSDLPCKKHPSNSSFVGICAYCLNEKLIELVCLECGEQRISSCSCSDLSSYRNSSCTVDVGSVGRVSFFIENEKGSNGEELKQSETEETGETEDVVLLKRSNSCVVEVKKSNGFWRIGKLFKKKRGGVDQKSEICAMDVSRSRSLSIDGGFHHEVGSIACSSAKISDFNELESRKSGFKGGFMDFKSGFQVKESDFSRIDDDDDEFIDLKIDLSNKSQTEHSVFKKCDSPDGGGMGSSSCRIMVNERGIKKVKNSHMKGWKWMFKHHSGKNDLNHILES
ncbi:hypothetical protein L1987_79208 [Smallanthus sonchifolius]|uniref:Uncharacterized protein n=1 Tax=Smallanthus sonchifolius TaxID=185202 RepID=A0ACB8ZFV2_9ASTR|nr:hypothetical protein L1987_79208 [Smallanthus sonchifolius]